MSAFSVSDLLNPAPLSHPSSPRVDDTMMHDDPSVDLAGTVFAPELFNEDNMDGAPSIFEQQGMIPLEHSSSPEFMRKDSVTTDMLHGMDTIMDDENGTSEAARRKDRSTKQRDPDKLKDTKHSSKNEGQHTDRRYLCYVCHKLFTRRRSVRDHLNKIHGEKTWEPQKSLEVVVEPHSGDPIEPIEEILARGPPAPPPKTAKTSKPSDDDKDERTESVESPQEDQEETAVQTMEKDKVEDTKHIVAEELAPVVEPAPGPEIQIDALEPEPVTEVKPEPESAPGPAKLKKEHSHQTGSRAASVEPVGARPCNRQEKAFTYDEERDC